MVIAQGANTLRFSDVWRAFPGREMAQIAIYQGVSAFYRLQVVPVLEFHVSVGAATPANIVA